MYFIGVSSRLALPIRDKIVEHHPVSGAVVNVRRPLFVKFSPAGSSIPDYAKEAVSKLAGFGRGAGEGEDPFDRCGHYDTDAGASEEEWTADEKAEVEAFLVKHQGYDYVRADAPALEAPWPTYDQLTGDTDDIARQVVQIAGLTGVTARQIAAYERQNASRPGLLEVLDILVAEE